MVGGWHFPDLAKLLPRMLDRKLVRDLGGMWVQAVAIALVIAGGISVHLVSAGMLDSLQVTRQAYYDRYKFADVWAPVVRAPETLLADIRELPGVEAAESRIRAAAVLDIPGMDAPASGEILSLPDGREPRVNRIHLTDGRIPRTGHRNEAVVLESFATAHDLQVGETLSATIHGGRADLRIVGLALSPEHVYSIAPGQIVPDPRLYGVIWMGRDALGQAVERDGAFNEAVILLRRGESEDALIDRLDRLLEPYGAPGAYGRDSQISDAFVSSEIDQLDMMAKLLPPIFLAVSAFLVNVVLSRLVAMEREEIGLLKAFGYSNREVISHYVKLAVVIGALGLVIGMGLGVWLGRALAQMYQEYYHFPFLVFRFDPRVFATELVVTVAAVGGGAILAAWRVAGLDTALAMRPPPPPDYSKAFGIGLTRWRVLDQQTRMIIRQIFRWPARSGFTLGGVAVSGGLLVGTMFFLDSMDRMIDVYFNISNRQDVAVSFVEPRSHAALHSVERLPGVLRAEPVRTVAVRLRHGAAEERAAITGYPRDPELARLVGEDGLAVESPPGSLVLSRDLADKLGAEAGQVLTVEVTEGERPVLALPVAAVTTTLIGSGVQMEIHDLNALLGEGAVVSGASLLVDSDAVAQLYARLKSSPGIAGVSLQSEAERTFIELMDEGIGASIVIYTTFAGLIAIGVVYNSVRISFSERQHELAVLRVLGFTRGEVAYVLLGEIALITLLALPVGAALGAALAWFFATSMSSDLFRLPYVIEAGTFGFAAVLVLATSLISALMIRSRLDKLDMVAVLKTGE